MEGLMEEVIHYKGYKISISQDGFCESPDEWGNENLFLVYAHRDFNVKRKGFEPKDIFEYLQDNTNHEYDNYWIFPVYAHIHSGISLSLGNSTYPFNDRWDVSTTGYILGSKDSFGTLKDAALTDAQVLIEIWNDYLNGNVYKYDIIKETTCIECGHTESVSVDCCGNYYGEDGKKQAINEAKSIIDNYGR